VPLTAVKQWCPDLDPVDPSGTAPRNVGRLWCPEAERAPAAAASQVVAGARSPLEAADWIPEQQVLPSGGAPALPVPLRLESRRGMTPRRDFRPQPRISIAPAANLEVVHATTPFFSDESATQGRGEEQPFQVTRNSGLRPARKHETTPNSGNESLTASTKSMSPDSQNDAWVDSARRHPRLTSLPLTPNTVTPSSQAIQLVAVSEPCDQGAGDQIVLPSKSRVLHCGRGGVGRRRETTNCNGRHAKSEVRRSHNCCLRVVPHTERYAIEFSFAEGSPHYQRVVMPDKTDVNVKGARVELVQPDGKHVWLWAVPPSTIVDICRAFTEVSNQAQGAEQVVSFASASGQAQMEARAEDVCKVQLGFVPAGVVPRATAKPEPSKKPESGETEDLSRTAPPPSEQRKPNVPALRLECLPPLEPFASSQQLETPHTSTGSESTAQPESSSRLQVCPSGTDCTFYNFGAMTDSSSGQDIPSQLSGYRRASPVVNLASNRPEASSPLPLSADLRSGWRIKSATAKPRLAGISHPISISTPAPQRLMETGASRQVINIEPSHADLRKAVAGRKYRSHLLQRIDPASTLNVAFSSEKVLSGAVQGARVCSPREMDQIIRQTGKDGTQNSIHTAVVLM